MITKMELLYDTNWAPIPAGEVPQGQGQVYFSGQNNMDTAQIMGVRWVIKDPQGLVVEEYTLWAWGLYTSPGDEQGFVGSIFNLDKIGTYTLELDLRVNPDSPIIIDSYSGNLCTIAGVVPDIWSAMIPIIGLVLVFGMIIPMVTPKKKRL